VGDRSDVVSSFTVIKGALVPETYQGFQHWDFGQDRRANLTRLKELNVFGARSANWLRDIGWVLNRRFEPNGRDRPLVRMAQADVDMEVWRPLLLCPHGGIRWRAETDKTGRYTVTPIRQDVRAAIELYLRKNPRVGTSSSTGWSHISSKGPSGFTLMMSSPISRIWKNGV
jgi:hypothetical protein